MASFGRARRVPGSGNAFLRPFAVLFVVSLALLLLRDTTFVRAGATFVTELLVPAERVLGQVGSTAGGFWQAIAEIENLRTDNDSLKARVDQLTLENVQLREQAFQAQQGTQLAEAAKALKLQTEDVKVGDVVITAGLAIGNDLKSLYPKGLILGRVVEVTKGENGTFQRAILVPAVDLRHLENVLVVNTSP